MSEVNKRGLRQRNKKNTFGDEIEEEQMNGYGRSYNKQIYNPSLQLNLDAKLLIKFVNFINKKHIQFNQESSKHQNKQNIRENSHQNFNQKNTIPNKSYVNKDNSAKNSNPPPVKKKINTTSSNGINQSMTYNKTIKNQEYLNRIKAMSQESASNMLQLQKSLNKNPNHNTNSTNRLVSASLKNKQQIKNGSIYNKQKPKINNNSEVKKVAVFVNGENNMLKKSMMHVWIAQFVYKNTIKKQKYQDPTLAAKKLKQKTFKQKQNK